MSHHLCTAGGSRLDVDGCWLIRVVAAEGWGGRDDFLKWDKNEVCHIEWHFTWTLRGHCGVINWLNFSIGVSQGTGRPKDRERDGGMTSQWNSQNTHNINQLSSPSYMGMVCDAPKQLQWYRQRSLITDHRDKYNDHEKVWNSLRITKMWHRHEVSKCCGENDLLNTGLQQTFNLSKTQYL